MNMWKVVCAFCGKEFTSDIEQRAKNDLIVHHQDNQTVPYSQQYIPQEKNDFYQPNQPPP